MQSFATVDNIVDIDSTVEAPQPLWQLVVDQAKSGSTWGIGGHRQSDAAAGGTGRQRRLSAQSAQL